MNQVFSGGVFSDLLDNGRVGAEIELTPSGVIARGPDGEMFSISYPECQIEMGGYNGRMVFCRNGDKSLTIFCDHKKFGSELSFASSGALDDQLGDSNRRRKSVSRRERIIAVSALTIILVALVGGYFGVKAGARAAVQALPTSVDRQIGTTAFSSMDLGGPEVTDEVVVGAMQTIVDRLSPHAAIDGMEFQVHVVDAPMINAFALPGGTMVVYTGLIVNAQNVDQVAAVLGHEMAHATLRHGLERIGHSMGIYAAITLLVGDAGGLMAAGADLFQIASVNSYSREQESSADAEGVRMLHSAGINPAEMSTFFQLLEEEHGDIPGVIAWISTHPDHASRIESVDALVAALPKREYKPLNVDWPAVQAQVKTPK